MKRWLLTLLLLAVFVGIWQLVSSVVGVDKLLLASPVTPQETSGTSARCCSTTRG